MEYQVVQRRLNRVLGHFAANEEVPSNLLFLTNCSSTLNHVARRCDNRTFFARQGSASQGCFMRQASIKENGPYYPEAPSASKNEKSQFQPPVAPVFSRPAEVKQMPPNYCLQSVKQGAGLSSTEPPLFARPGQTQTCISKTRQAFNFTGQEGSPRTDIAESGRRYVLTIELPGIGMNDIRVEVDERNLTVTRKRPSRWWKVANFDGDTNTRYLRREIVPGPYQVVWPLPSDVNKDGVSAELVNGFLQIDLPKLRG